MSCHVSVVPNHQTRRTSSMHSRVNIAHLGATGYELDTSNFTDADRERTKSDIEAYTKKQDLIINGDLYRTEDRFNSNYFGFMVVAKDKSEALLTVFRSLGKPNDETKYFKVRGLDENKTYSVSGFESTFKGSTLMRIGLPCELPKGDYESTTYTFKEVK